EGDEHAAPGLGRAGGDGVVATRAQPDRLEELARPVRPVAAEPAAQLLGAVHEERRADGQAKEEASEIHGDRGRSYRCSAPPARGAGRRPREPPACPRTYRERRVPRPGGRRCDGGCWWADAWARWPRPRRRGGPGGRSPRCRAAPAWASRTAR